MRPTLLVTIDTESDDLWARKPELTFANIERLPRLQRFLEKNSVRPTYLVSYPVATSKTGCDVLRPLARAGAAEIGSHMHVWTTPPLEPLTEKDYEYCPLATEISYDSHYRKLKAATDAVGELAGRAPRAHRAGRYGLDANGLRVLEELGYGVDTSVTPLEMWREPDRNGGWRGPDFRNAPLEPYYPAHHDVSSIGRSSVLEVPVSIFLTRSLGREWTRRLARLPRNNNLIRALRWSGVARHAWLRPGREVNGRMLAGLARAVVAAGIPVLNVMFHSSEMCAGTSPHTPSENEVDDSYRQLEELFRVALGELHAQPMTLSELAAAWREQHAPQAAVA
jgi:hypothetical protein